MKKGYEKQILNHNVEKFSLMMKDDINIFSSIEILTKADKNTALQVNFIKSSTEDMK